MVSQRAARGLLSVVVRKYRRRDVCDGEAGCGPVEVEGLLLEGHGRLHHHDARLVIIIEEARRTHTRQTREQQQHRRQVSPLNSCRQAVGAAVALLALNFLRALNFFMALLKSGR